MCPARESRSDESAGQGKLPAAPRAPIPYLAPRGLAASGPADRLLSTRGPERDRKFWGLGEGGCPQPLGTLGKKVSLGA